MSATATGDHEGRVDARPRRHRLPAGLLRLASDERLVELLRAGSEAAFEALYTRHHRGVLAFCRHMLGSPEEAEDAVQHTFLAAYADLVASRKQIQLRPWLYAIARNRCFTVLRTRREGGSDELVEPSTEQLSTEVERRQDLRALLGDLAGLPDDQRAALVLAELGDLSHDEIGEALGCPREKVKALVFQARSSLIASREARETSCTDIREQLANLRGGSLRRNVLRRHLRECVGCREFRAQVQAQRRQLALILPVAPSLGLQAAVLGGGAAATSSIVAKTAIVLAVAGTGAAAVEVVREAPPERASQPAKVASRPPATVPAAAVAPAAASRIVQADDPPRAVDPAGTADRGRARRHDRAAGDRGRHRDARAERGSDRRRGPVPASEHGRSQAQARGREAAPRRGLARGQEPGHSRGRHGSGGAKVRPNAIRLPQVARPQKPAKEPRPVKAPKVETPAVLPPVVQETPAVEKAPAVPETTEPQTTPEAGKKAE